MKTTNAPIQIRKLFKHIQLLGAFIGLTSKYGEEVLPKEVPASFVTRMVIDRYLHITGANIEDISEKDKDLLKERFGIELIDDPVNLQIRNAYNFIKKIISHQRNPNLTRYRNLNCHNFVSFISYD